MIRFLQRHPPRDLLALVEGLVLFSCARLALVLIPFRVISRRLGEAGGESPADIDTQQLCEAHRVGWAVRAASRLERAPDTCLAQAIAAHLMLRRRGIPGTVYFGVAIPAPGAMIAHAWVRAGSAILTGEPGHERFQVASSFGPLVSADQPQ
jgi:hypothetical protein